MAIIALLIVRKLVESDRKIFSISNLIYFLFMILPGLVLYQTKYNLFVLLVSFFVYIIVFIKMFDLHESVVNRLSKTGLSLKIGQPVPKLWIKCLYSSKNLSMGK